MLSYSMYYLKSDLTWFSNMFLKSLTAMIILKTTRLDFKHPLTSAGILRVVKMIYPMSEYNLQEHEQLTLKLKEEVSLLEEIGDGI